MTLRAAARFSGPRHSHRRVHCWAVRERKREEECQEPEEEWSLRTYHVRMVIWSLEIEAHRGCQLKIVRKSQILVSLGEQCKGASGCVLSGALLKPQRVSKTTGCPRPGQRQFVSLYDKIKVSCIAPKSVCYISVGYSEPQKCHSPLNLMPQAAMLKQLSPVILPVRAAAVGFPIFSGQNILLERVQIAVHLCQVPTAFQAV